MGAVLPEEVLQLAAELARVDALLDDPVFFAPFVPFFDPRLGRPSTPMEVYLRLMFLKFRYRLGYETLCREVTDSITWRRFCRIPLDGQVPHPTTLIPSCPPMSLIRPTPGGWPRRFVGWPPPPGGCRLPGGGTRTRLRDRSRAAGARAREIGAKLRLYAAQGRDEAHATVRRVTGELAGLAERPATKAEKLLVNARRAVHRAQREAAHRTATGKPNPAAGRRRGRLRRAVNDLTGLLAATRRIAMQTGQRLSGTTPDGATRKVSLHDGNSRDRQGALGPAGGVRLQGRARRAHRGDPAQGPTRQGAPSPRTPAARSVAP